MKRLTPQTANTFEKVCQLKADNLDYRDYWILVQEKHVIFAKQETGKPVTAMISIPKTFVNKFIKFYTGN